MLRPHRSEKKSKMEKDCIGLRRLSSAESIFIGQYQCSLREAEGNKCSLRHFGTLNASLRSVSGKEVFLL
jgi:hypothetical protein